MAIFIVLIKGMVDVEQESDLKYIVEKSKKNPEAFIEIYDLFFDKIYGYVYYKVGNTEDAEDITEQVFLKALEAIGKFKWKGAYFSSWLFRIARNQIIDHFRRQAKSADSLTDDQINKIPDKKENLEEIIEARLSLENVEKAILRLTEEQQNVIILKFLSGFSNAEIAKFFNKSEGAVKALQHRALSSLRKIKGELLNE